MTPEHRRLLFDRDPDRYRTGRPGYPAELFRNLAERCGLKSGCQVLEIGPGTGQATASLLAIGAQVVAVELGPALAATTGELLASAVEDGQLTIEVGAFEELPLGGDLEPESFDLVVSATAFHWVPQPVGFQRVHQLLKPGGHVALWWNFFGDPVRPDPFHHAIQPLLAASAPELMGDDFAAGAHPYALDVEARCNSFDQSGLFGPVTHDRIPWTGRHSPAEIRAMFGSFSPWLNLDAEVREPLLDDLEALAADRFGGLVERPYNTALYTAARR